MSETSISNIMEFIGKTAIHPLFVLFREFSGYLTWIILILIFLKITVVKTFSVAYNEHISVLFLIIGLFFIVFSFINLGSTTRLFSPTENTVFKTNGLYKISRKSMY